MSTMMPAERADFCTMCGTAPCRHPDSDLTVGLLLHREKQLANALVALLLLLVLAVIGWVV
jgi:hypothetical protein